MLYKSWLFIAKSSLYLRAILALLIKCGSLLPIILNEVSAHRLIGSRTSVLCKLQQLFSPWFLVFVCLWLSLCRLLEYQFAHVHLGNQPKTHGKSYIFLNFLLYIVPCFEKNLATSTSSSSDLCLLSSLRLLLSFLSLNMHLEKPRPIVWLI